jgi:dihydrofolate synthase/folylpolyglutamate synthase
MTGVAFAFADAPVDVMVIECGMGGRWDATNVVEPAVTVITPVELDHQEYLGSGLAEIAAEKAGIIKAGAPVVMGRQTAAVAEVIEAVAAAVDVPVVRRGSTSQSSPGRWQWAVNCFVGGLRREYADIFLPLHSTRGQRSHRAGSSRGSFFGEGGRRLNAETKSALDSQRQHRRGGSVLRTGPTVVVDAAQSGRGAGAGRQCEEAFDFSHVIAVVAVLADKGRRRHPDRVGDRGR